MAGQYHPKPHKKAAQTLSQRFQILYRRLGKILVRRLYHTVFRPDRQQKRTASAGFVLPTTVMMLLVTALTVAALVFRAYSHTTQVIGESQQRVIYNAATPAIDRARAKLETLFDSNRDTRYPGGVPAENYLTGMLRNDGSYSVAALPGAPATDMYTLPGETRINLDNQTKTGEARAEDNAWAFRTDTNGDGANDATVVYSIVMQTPPDSTAGVPGSGVVTTDDRAKAQNQWVRTAPLSNRQRGNCGNANSQVASAAQGWFEDLSNSSTLRKNFQIDALVIPDNATNRPNFVTLEMQQDRQLNRGNKWGAWFRNDLEVFPGAAFNWNGAMHTEGNLIIRPNGGSFTAFLVSAQNSCLMSSPFNSEITVTNIANPTNDATQKPDFIGGTLSASLIANSYGGNSSIHIWPALNNGPSQSVTLDTTTQSANQVSTPAQMALDPNALLTRDVSVARGTDTSNRGNVTGNWLGLPTDSRNPRITNRAEPKPYVDDLYRADDRWGPKPRYTDQLVLRGTNQQPGALITSANVSNPDDLNTLISNTAPADNPASVGLDGYWERRAIVEGARVIVGQRLELGNAFGWTNNDPMYPPNATSMTHEQRQRRMLRDNLAAVQASAIYHSANPGGSNFPAACLASTSHPGTATTLQNSIDFRTTNRTFYNSSGTAVPLLTDFLNGNGTNGWEFAPPASTEANFSSAIADGQPLGNALRNLAYFAGDPDGAFPPLQEAARVHPYPNLTMWGNFSELRRTLRRMDTDGVAYSALSPADKTTLHTAACTLGMLAYNVDIAQQSDLSGTISGSNISNGQKVSLGEAIWQNFEGIGNKPDLFERYCLSGTGTSSNPYVCDLLPSITASKNDPLLSDLSNNQFSLAIQILNKDQIWRDRTYGFADSPIVAATNSFTVQGTGNRHYRFRFPANCDPNNPAGSPIGIISPTGNGLDQKKAGLAMLCASKPKYPALFYLFPRETHDHDGIATPTPINNNVGNAQPTSEPYIADTHIRDTVNPPATVQYRVVGSTVDDLSGVIIQPRATDFSNWVLPNSAQQAVTGANVSPNLIVAPNNNTLTLRAVGFLERAIFNGREMMTTRVMDIDVGMLRSRGINSQPWLPVSGIIYAFREDAMREDEIARPPSGTATNATTAAGTDPALTTTPEGIQISTKPVDFLPDPDRRPHGFRLRNGAQVSRNASFNIPAANNIRGLSFFTDDLVYIQGAFNLHQTGGDDTVGTRLEEFTLQLNGDYSQFYNRTTRDGSFARPTTDRWRPSEVLADGIYILSDTFCDGSLQDTFVSPTATVYHNTTTPGLWGPGCTGSNTSFTNQNLPTGTSPAWLREDNTTTSTTLPVEINRNGQPLVSGGAYTGNYQGFGTSKALMTAQNTTINAIVVSGIVPSRVNQAYGGLHNFPRFLESWGGRTFQFNGSFMQLNFSNYATGPYDQDAWEPTNTPASSENIRYYGAPTRAWGYDTALQLAPAGPAAARFITAGQNRNEFYTEVAVSDAYMNQLCTAFNAAPRGGALAQSPASVPCP